ncbi:hypothetical protein C8R45DRAFT_351758 [Mycena sanguinolenta]|nr:hypothetical protein C8R45DRAFT_351758 [Mycena sanguinolenta]
MCIRLGHRYHEANRGEACTDHNLEALSPPKVERGQGRKGKGWSDLRRAEVYGLPKQQADARHCTLQKQDGAADRLIIAGVASSPPRFAPSRPTSLLDHTTRVRTCPAYRGTAVRTTTKVAVNMISAQYTKRVLSTDTMLGYRIALRPDAQRVMIKESPPLAPNAASCACAKRTREARSERRRGPRSAQSRRAVTPHPRKGESFARARASLASQMGSSRFAPAPTPAPALPTRRPSHLDNTATPYRCLASPRTCTPIIR